MTTSDTFYLHVSFNPFDTRFGLFVVLSSLYFDNPVATLQFPIRIHQVIFPSIYMTDYFPDSNDT